jgi:maltose O-acetyltransferase
MAGSDGRSEKEKMLAGELYRAVGPELAADNLRADRLLRAYNATA